MLAVRPANRFRARPLHKATMSNVGVIGLGAMGMGVARSLLRAGFAVHACDVRAGVADAFAVEGGVACASPADVARQVDVIVSVVVNAAQTEAVLFGEGGAVAAMEPGSVFASADGRPRRRRSSSKRGWERLGCISRRADVRRRRERRVRRNDDDDLRPPPRPMRVRRRARRDGGKVYRLGDAPATAAR